MSTVINVSPCSLMSLGSTTLSTSDNEEIATTMFTFGTTLLSGSVTIKAHAQEIETTKSYVESLSQEEINDMLKMLDEREVHINDMGKKLTLKY